jgi:Protein of unknown function (DUF2541)
MVQKILIVSFLLASFLDSQSLLAQQEGTGTGTGKWEVLGLRVVPFTSDRDVIPVTNKGIYRAIKLRVFNGNIKIYRFVVFFDDGSSQEFPVNHVIKKGEVTGVRELKGNTKAINRIELWYNGTKGSTGRTVNIQALGLN